MAEYKRIRVKSVSGVPMPLFGKSQPELSSDPYEGVLRGVQNFMDAVSKGIRGIKFGYMHSANKVAVYMEGHPYTMGWIGFFDHRDNPSEEIPHYIVSSNNINNGKYTQYLMPILSNIGYVNNIKHVFTKSFIVAYKHSRTLTTLFLFLR